MEGWLVFYVGGCVATAAALLAVSRMPHGGGVFHARGAFWYATLLCLLWLPMMLVAIVAPRLINRKRRR